jgi:type II secretion system protein N
VIPVSWRGAAYLGYALLVYVGCLILLYPYATLVEGLLAEHAPVPLRFQGTEVRPWAVSGESLAIALETPAPLVVRRWTLRPDWTSLWQGRQQAQVSGHLLGGGMEGTLSRRGGMAEMDLRLRTADAGQLIKLWSGPSPFEPRGLLDGEMHIECRPEGSVARARLRLHSRDGKLDVPPLGLNLALGQVSLDAGFEGAGLVLSLSAHGGDLDLGVRAEAELQTDWAQSALRGRGEVRPTPRTPPALRDWLTAWNAHGAGTLSFQVSGTLKAPRWSPLPALQSE